MDYVDLTEEAMESIRGRDLDEPIAMVNLLKFRDLVDPALGLGTMSGRDCYFGHYIAGVPPIAHRLGTGHSPLYLNDVDSCFFCDGGRRLGLPADSSVPLPARFHRNDHRSGIPRVVEISHRGTSK